jgi:hypothetical protein
MADSKISNLNAVTTLASGDVVPIVNNSVTKKATASQLSSYSQLGWARYDDSQISLILHLKPLVLPLMIL